MSKKIPKDERQFWIQRGFKDPQAAYTAHKCGAKARGIEFLMTPMEWWEIWAPHYHLRGTKPGMLVMCRYKDEGPYKVGNVRIDTAKSNLLEGKQTAKWKRVKAEWEGNTASVMWMDDRASMYEPSHLLEKEEELY